MASSKVYETFPVHPGSMEIRFLELRPPFSDVLSCKLSVVTLKSGPPPFIALSYEWGADDANHVMSLDGHDVSIRHNLWLALKNITKHHARLVQDCQNHHQRPRQDFQKIHWKWAIPTVPHPTDSLFIWVDAICIDQDNIPERNHQVDLMRDIYSSAALVLVWLGPAADDSAFAIRNIRYEKPGTGLVRKEFLAVHRLLCRTYWERMWIVQEFILGRSVLVHCGDGYFYWRELWKFLQAYEALAELSERHRNLYAGLESSLGVKVVRAKQDFSDSAWALDLPELVLQWSGQKCMDPRDRVFALLGIPVSAAVWRDEKAEGFRVDYSRSAEQVYSDVCRCFGSTLKPVAMEAFSTKLMGILDVQSSHEIVERAHSWTKTSARENATEFSQ